MYTEPENTLAVESSLLSLIINAGDNGLFLRADEVLNPEYFSDPFHQRLYKELQHMVLAHSIRIDKSLLKAKIKQPEYKQKFERVLAEHTTLDNFTEYVSSIKDAYQSRRYKEILRNALVQTQVETEGNPIHWISSLEDDLLGIVSDNTNSFITPNDVMPEIFKQIAEGKHMAKMITPIPDLNAMLYGIQPVYYIVAARPSMGKTAFVMDWAIYNALRGHRTLVFSLEMDSVSLTNRLVANVAEIPHYKLRSRDLSPAEMGKLNGAAETINTIPLHIDDTPGISANEIAARAKRFKIKYPDLDMIVIDYIQLVSEGGGGGNREREVSKMSQVFKNLGRALGVPVIALSQLSRKVEERQDKRPILSDLRDSGSLEQDADVVIFLFADSYYDNQRKSFSVWDTEIIVSKHRNGPVGIISSVHEKDYQKFKPPGGHRGDEDGNEVIFEPETDKVEGINVNA